MRLTNRIERLEANLPPDDFGPAFLWPHGQSLANALEHARLTLDDKPLAIRLVAVVPDREPIVCPLYEREKHLLESWPET